VSPQDRTIRFYDSSMVGAMQTAYYENSDFFNWGYWTSETSSQREASENLVEKLLAFIPEKSGRILDVACGLGATTRQLTRYYPPDGIVGINISDKQVAHAHKNLPSCSFLTMDATHLGFPDCSFDNIICVEAAFHFDTRDQFLKEALRVLKPGGWLVHSDVLLRRPGLLKFISGGYPSANDIKNPDMMGRRLAAVGFENIEVEDATKECWNAFSKNIKAWPKREFRAGRINRSLYRQARRYSFFYRLGVAITVKYYTLCAAQKPYPA
jgi:MPBQ/MSBQ methyltransferase